MKTLSTIILTLCLSIVFAWDNYKINSMEARFSMNIQIDSFLIDTWEGVSYEFLDDTASQRKYIQIIDEEYSKYPAKFFEFIGIKNIVVCQDLKFKGQKRQSIPDPYKNTLYLDGDFTFFGYSEDYLAHCTHHELHHCTEYAIWGDMYYKWDEWAALNQSGFDYGNGGAETYLKENDHIDFYSMCHPIPGFCNLYSMQGQEEDRAELMSYIMYDSQRETLIEYCQKDPILVKKIYKLMEVMDQVSQTTDNYWRNNIKLKK